jgi:hypothetical protein
VFADAYKDLLNVVAFLFELPAVEEKNTSVRIIVRCHRTVRSGWQVWIKRLGLLIEDGGDGAKTETHTLQTLTLIGRPFSTTTFLLLVLPPASALYHSFVFARRV